MSVQQEAHLLTKTRTNHTHVRRRLDALPQALLTILGIGAILFLALHNLTNYPTPWFDEGSHLHVPKTLVRFGVYADYSSEGFRHYGPTIGVGPTVLLPVAAAFKLFGIGLLQARLVMVLYLLAAVAVFYYLAYRLHGEWLAWVATTLLVVTPGVAFLEYGRQVLGEVPGLFFVLAGLSVWFATWPRVSWRRLMLVGLLLGLAMVTKHQYLLLLTPSLGFAWLANLIYYRSAPQRTFIVPGVVATACFILWQAYLIVYLGPATAKENLAMFREFTSGAALVFSPELMRRGITELLSLKVYLGILPAVVIYGFTLALPRQKDGQRWGLLWILLVVNLVWYVVASIGWLRYAFPGLAIASLFVARFFYDVINGLSGRRSSWWPALRWLVLTGLAVLIILSAGRTVRQIMLPAHNAPLAMGAYLDENVPHDALIETWEPEMGFLTNHNYHFPPPLLLNNAVGHKWLGKPSPAQEYDFVQTERPDYVLLGEFARWVQLYPADFLAQHYKPVTSIGAFELYKLRSE